MAAQNVPRAWVTYVEPVRKSQNVTRVLSLLVMAAKQSVWNAMRVFVTRAGHWTFLSVDFAPVNCCAVSARRVMYRVMFVIIPPVCVCCALLLTHVEFVISGYVRIAIVDVNPVIMTRWTIAMMTINILYMGKGGSLL